MAYCRGIYMMELWNADDLILIAKSKEELCCGCGKKE